MQMQKVLIIDNYDSFTFNLVHYLEDLNAAVTVFRNDEFELQEIEAFDKIILSPGPGIPDEAGLLKEVIKTFAPTKSILGVCLGHQAIAEVFNSKLINLKSTLHGISSKVTILDETETLFTGLPNQIEVGHYHSWVVNPDTISEEIVVTSVDSDNNIMSLRHIEFDVKGIQFHPESILTPFGKTILKNWLNKD
jgi:anthranilate synthase component 2